MIIMNPLYMNDCYLKEFDATVVSVNGKYVVLDNTAFYPNSGGQPNDIGVLRCNDNDYKVVYVAKIDGAISHEVDHEGLKPGDKVHGIIDWERRYIHMRYHTASHIMSGLINKLTGAEITGNQIAADKTRFDFNLKIFDKDMVKQWEEMANKIISEEHDVIIKTLPREEAFRIPSLVKLAKGFPEDIQNIRIVNIEGFDQQACGGTHVRNTREIGRVEFTKMENKGKDNRRIYFVIK
jgi:misacylated tRNA(Ala) deacylase